MVILEENFVNDWIYKIMQLVFDEPHEARDELLNMSHYILNAPQADSQKVNYPKPNIRSW